MRVLVVPGMYPTPDRPWAGGFVHRQAVELAAKGVAIEVLCPLPSRWESLRIHGRGGERTEYLDGVRVTYFPYQHVPLRLSPALERRMLIRALVREARNDAVDRKFDLVHAHTLFPAGAAAMRLAQDLGVPFIASARGSDVHTHPVRNKGIARYTRGTIRESDQIVAVSGALAEEITRLAEPRRPVEVVYNGVDVNHFRSAATKPDLRSRLGVQPDSMVICTVCRLVREKGVLELLDAFAKLCAMHQHLTLTVVGDGPLRKTLANRIGNDGLGGRVILTGGLLQEGVRDWLSIADVFVLATYNEGLPNVILEAMACGLPIVATDVGGIPEAAPDGTVARLVRPRDVRALADALEIMIRDPDLRRMAGTAAYDRARDVFSWDRSARDLIRVYAAVLSKSQGQLASRLSLRDTA